LISRTSTIARSSRHRTQFLTRIIDGSLQVLSEWRERQKTVEPVR
jgi:hypothetical protein